MPSNFIHVRIHHNVAVLELDDPSANTLTFHMLQELEQVFIGLENTPGMAGVIVIGRGDKFFSGGVNIGMLLTASRQHNSHFILYAAEILDYMANSHLPIVALINGNITGGGLELALIADHRIAVEGHYNIGFPEVRLGVIPGMGGTQRLARLVGPQRALEMITQGEFINPQKSKLIGLVDHLLPAENFREMAIQQAIAYIHAHSNITTDVLAELRETIKPLPDDAITLTLTEGLAIIEIEPICDDFNADEVLLALNQKLLVLRTDDDVYALLIKNNASGIGRSSSQMSVVQLEKLADYIFSRISGYPRICSLFIDRPLSNLEMLLALHCDYRLCLPAFAQSSIEQPMASHPILERYRGYFEASPQAHYPITALVTNGFYLSSSHALEWMRRFIPPIGAGRAIGYGKLAITQGYRESVSAALLLERHLQEQLFMGHDSQEGMTAYIQKRKPVFNGV